MKVLIVGAWLADPSDITHTGEPGPPGVQADMDRAALCFASPSADGSWLLEVWDKDITRLGEDDRDAIGQSWHLENPADDEALSAAITAATQAFAADARGTGDAAGTVTPGD